MSLGSLVVDLTANTAQFRSDLGKAAQLSNKFTSDMTKNAKIAATGFLALASAASVTALAVTKNAIDNADNMRDLSKAAGISVESFSALAFAAKQSGVDIDGLSKVMKTINDNLLEAATNGKSEAATMFKVLGVEINKTDGSLKTAEQTLLSLSDAFSKIPEGAERSAAMTKLMGKNGAMMASMMEGGSASIVEMTEKAKDLGYVISTDLANSADEFNDNMGEINASLAGFGFSMAEYVLPSVNSFIKNFKDANKQLGVYESLVNSVSRLFDETPADKIGKDLHDVYEEIYRIQQLLKDPSVSRDQGAKSRAEDRLTVFTAKAKELEKQLVTTRKAQDGLFDKPSSDNQPNPGKEYIDFAAQSAIAADQFMKRYLEVIEQNKKLADSTEKVTEKTKELREEISLLSDDYIDQSLDAWQASGELSAQAGETISEISEMAKEAARNTQDAIADMLMDGFDDGAKGALISFGEMLRKMIAQAAAAQIGRYLFGDFSSGGSVGGLVGSLVSGIGSMIGGGSSPVSSGPFDIGSPDFTLPGAASVPAAMMQMTVNVSGVNNPGEMRQAAGAGARQALALMQGAQRYA